MRSKFSYSAPESLIKALQIIRKAQPVGPVSIIDLSLLTLTDDDIIKINGNIDGSKPFVVVWPAEVYWQPDSPLEHIPDSLSYLAVDPLNLRTLTRFAPKSNASNIHGGLWRLEDDSSISYTTRESNVNFLPCQIESQIEAGQRSLLWGHLIDSGAIRSTPGFHLEIGNKHSRRLFEVSAMFDPGADDSPIYRWRQRLLAYMWARILIGQANHQAIDCVLYQDRTPGIVANQLALLLKIGLGKLPEIKVLDCTPYSEEGHNIAFLTSVANRGHTVLRAEAKFKKAGAIPVAGACVASFFDANLPDWFVAILPAQDRAYTKEDCPMCLKGEPALDIVDYPRYIRLRRPNLQGQSVKKAGALGFQEFWTMVIDTDALVFPGPNSRGRHHPGTFVDTRRFAWSQSTANQLSSVAARMLEANGIFGEPQGHQHALQNPKKLVPLTLTSTGETEDENLMAQTIVTDLENVPVAQRYLALPMAVKYEAESESYCMTPNPGSGHRGILFLSGISSGATIWRALSYLASEGFWCDCIVAVVNRLSSGSLTHVEQTLAIYNDATLLTMYDPPLPSFEPQDCPKERDDALITKLRGRHDISTKLSKFIHETSLDQLSFHWRQREFSAAAKCSNGDDIPNALLQAYSKLEAKFASNGKSPDMYLSLLNHDERGVPNREIYLAWMATDAAAKAGEQLLERIRDEYCPRAAPANRLPIPLAAAVVRGLSNEQIQSTEGKTTEILNDLVLNCHSEAGIIALEAVIALVEDQVPGWEKRLAEFLHVRCSNGEDQLYASTLVRLFLASDRLGELLSRIIAIMGDRNEPVFESFAKDLAACRRVITGEVAAFSVLWRSPGQAADSAGVEYSVQSEEELANIIDRIENPSLIINTRSKELIVNRGLPSRSGKQRNFKLCGLLAFLPDQALNKKDLDQWMSSASNREVLKTLFNEAGKSVPPSNADLSRMMSDFRKSKLRSSLIEKNILVDDDGVATLNRNVGVLVVT